MRREEAVRTVMETNLDGERPKKKWVNTIGEDTLVCA